jgi:type II secretory pathway pseudopilin PulG
VSAGPASRFALRGERGMSLIEVVIAGLLLVIASLAVITVVNASIHNNFRAQQSQVVADRMQQELETITQTPYAQLAMTSAPAASAGPNTPSSRVSGTNFAIDRAGGTLRPMAYNGGAIPQGGTVSGGTVAPGGPSDPSAHFTSGNVKGTIYRYVVWDNQASCPAPAAPCMKRAIVAIVLDPTASGGTHVYQEVQGQVFDPGAKRNTGGNPGGDGFVPWTFWLTDTACNFSSRQPITADHLTHNTRSTCGTANSGSRTGSNAGPPDLMYTQAPPVDNSFPDDQQPLYDYATDVEPSSGPNTDKGLQELSSGNCSTLQTLVDGLPLGLGNLFDGNNYLKVHKWLSQKVPAGFNNILFHGDATLNLWTQTINNGIYGGGVCVWLARELNILGQAIDVPIVHLSGGLEAVAYHQNPWPHGGWTEISIPIPIDVGTNLLVGYQLGLAVAVDQSNTGGGLQFAYDAPSYDSRLQVQTSGSLPF